MKKILSFLVLVLAFTACSFKSTQYIKIKDKQALVIGNSYYQEGRLENSLKDAIAMKNFLETKGFRVTFVRNGTTNKMRRSIKLFINRLSSRSIAFVYYSGHGTQEDYKGDTKNYLIPINNKRIRTLKQLDRWAISLDEILDPMLKKNQGLNIVLLDACRTSMMRSFSRSRKKGFAPTRANGLFIAYATESGKTASDSGLFRKSFIKYANQNLELNEILENVKKETQNSIGQTPFIYDDKSGDFKFSDDTPIQIQNKTDIQIYNRKYRDKYAFYGHCSSKKTRWYRKYFKILNRKSYQGIPQAGDVLLATGDVNIRSGPMYKQGGSWWNAKAIGLIRKGNTLTIKEVREVVPNFYWIRF